MRLIRTSMMQGTQFKIHSDQLSMVNLRRTRGERKRWEIFQVIVSYKKYTYKD